MPNDFGGHACDDCVLGDIRRNDCAGTDDGVCADVNAGKNGRVGTNVGSVADHDGLNCELSCNDGHVDRFAGMRGTEDFGSWTPSYVVFEHEVASIEVGMGTDPNMIADTAGAIEASLDHGLGADEDGVAEFHCLRMFDDDFGADLESVASGAAHGTKDDAAQLGLERAFLTAISGIQGEQFFG